MSRSIASIFKQSTTAYVAATVAAGLVNTITGQPLVNPAEWSDYDLQQLLIYNCSVAIATFEQLYDKFVADTETLIVAAAPQTAPWIQNLVLNIFQYNATNPQVIQLDTLNIAPYYINVNPAYRIVTQCAVVPGAYGITTVKVAKAGPVALTNSELAALQSTLNIVTVPGVNINASTAAADKLYVGATLTYIGQYDSVINVPDGTVVKAIQAYLAAIPASGIASINSVVGLVKLTDLIAAVRAVPGVVDFELNDVNARADGTAYVPGTNNLVTGSTWLAPEYNSGLSGAGYVVTETTTGSTINDSITYTAV